MWLAGTFGGGCTCGGGRCLLLPAPHTTAFPAAVHQRGHGRLLDILPAVGPGRPCRHRPGQATGAGAVFQSCCSSGMPLRERAGWRECCTTSGQCAEQVWLCRATCGWAEWSGTGFTMGAWVMPAPLSTLRWRQPGALVGPPRQHWRQKGRSEHAESRPIGACVRGGGYVCGSYN